MAKLPTEVVAAFASPLDLQFRWSADLRDAMQKDPDGVLERARAVKQLTPRPAPATIFAMLVAQGAAASPVLGGEVRADEDDIQWNAADGTKLATMKADRRGRVILSIGQPLDRAQRLEFSKMVDAFFKGSTRTSLARRSAT